VFPQVFVRDVTLSVAWYRDVLGCHLDYVYGSPPFYAQLSRAGLLFNLRHSTIAPWHPSTPDQDLLAMRIEVDDVTALYSELRNHDACERSLKTDIHDH
jgi:catechol 2,3-dioxygenase-like lactoylglutathione lyase family enzyme